MKCEDIQQFLSEYWDWPDDELHKHQVDFHLRGCACCAEEFRLWKESAELIKDYSSYVPEPVIQERVAQSVMNRIYTDESWRKPIPTRTYHISFRMRKLISLMMSFFLALFVFSFFYALTGHGISHANNGWVTMDPIAKTISSSLLDFNEGDSMFQGVPIASISDPLVLRMGTIQTDPNYWVVLSLLGIASVLLAFNWLSRTRA